MKVNKKHNKIVGIDEAGRGPLAGPVVAAAVILDDSQPIMHLTDSKLLSPSKRETLYDIITVKALAVAVGRAEVAEIDAINILQGSLLAMKRAYEALNMQADLALVDGIHCPKLTCTTQAIVKGDLTEPAISAASIIAKVTRDREMIALDERYPQYGFAKHKGYPTKAHLAALQKYGVSEIHRRSFAPVKKLCLTADYTRMTVKKIKP